MCLCLCVCASTVYLTAFSIQLHISTNSNNKIIAIVACMRDGTPAVFTWYVAYFIHARNNNFAPALHRAHTHTRTLSRTRAQYACLSFNACRARHMIHMPFAIRTRNGTRQTYIKCSYSSSSHHCGLTLPACCFSFFSSSSSSLPLSSSFGGDGSVLVVVCTWERNYRKLCDVRGAKYFRLSH